MITPSRPGYDATPDAVGRTAQDAADSVAALLDSLNISSVAVIGISAAGPTALAFAQQHPGRIEKLILESAVTLPWEPGIKRQAQRIFGRAEKLTWAALKLMLRLMPTTTTQTMLRELTTLDVQNVWQRMSPEDIAFVQRMIRSMRSGTGFINDIEHQVDDLHGIRAPALVMYSPYDKSVPPAHAQRMSREVAQAELCEVPADSHLIWIGLPAEQVWQKRLGFLKQ